VPRRHIRPVCRREEDTKKKKNTFWQEVGGASGGCQPRRIVECWDARIFGSKREDLGLKNSLGEELEEVLNYRCQARTSIVEQAWA